MITIIILALLCFAAPQVHAQPVTIPFLADDHHSATTILGPKNIPLGASIATIVILPGKNKQGRLSGNQTMTFVFERSNNSGMRYEPAGGAEFDATKQPATFHLLLPEPGNGTRTLRGWVTFYGGNWRGKIDVEIE